MRTLTNPEGRTGFPDGETEAEFFADLAGWGPRNGDRLPNGPVTPQVDRTGFAVFDAAVGVREGVYGPDRAVWPSQVHRPDAGEVAALEGVPFEVLIGAALEAAGEGDRRVLDAAFCIRPEGGAL